MKKIKTIWILSFVLNIVLLGVLAINNKLSTPYFFADEVIERNFDYTLKLYREFLQVKRTAKSRNGESNYLLGNIYGEGYIYIDKYALFDMNGDYIPELHVFSAMGYEIFTCMDNELIHWASFNAWSRPLNNQAVLSERHDGANSPIQYTYYVLDFYGNEKLRIDFDVYNINDEGFYDENSDYVFENLDVTKEEWDILTKKYLSIGSDLIIWYDYEEDGIAF